MRAGTSARTAIVASIGVHVLVAMGIVALFQRDDPVESATRFDTRADVHFEIANESEPVSEPVTPFVPDPPKPPETPIEPPRVPNGPPMAQVIEVPHALPPELLALIKRPSPAPAAAVQPAAATAPKGPAWVANGSPVHGALDAKQCIVYVLDASGSMGEWGKFDAARAALIATLKLQPASVRFQVIVYSGAATTLLRSPPGECRPATLENLARVIDALVALPAPAGRSNHAEGLRAALAFRPDLVVLFTDADDLPLGPIRGILKQAGRPATLCTVKATAKGVEPPVELK